MHPSFFRYKRLVDHREFENGINKYQYYFLYLINNKK
jgi:hypothetical protein